MTDFVKCSNCSSLIPISVIENYGDKLCKHCYLNSFIYECDTCGREITKFETDYNNGECYNCNPDC